VVVGKQKTTQLKLSQFSSLWACTVRLQIGWCYLFALM